MFVSSELHCVVLVQWSLTTTTCPVGGLCFFCQNIKLRACVATMLDVLAGEATEGEAIAAMTMDRWQHAQTRK